MTWSVFFKGAFQTLRESAWKSNSVDVPKQDRLRREYYLGSHSVATYSNIEDTRATKHKEHYFSHQLLDHKKQKVEVEEGEEEAEYDGNRGNSRAPRRTKQTAAMAYSQQPMMAQQSAASARMMQNQSAQ